MTTIFPNTSSEFKFLQLVHKWLFTTFQIRIPISSPHIPFGSEISYKHLWFLYFFPPAIYLLNKLSHLSCRISQTLSLAHCNHDVSLSFSIPCIYNWSLDLGLIRISFEHFTGGCILYTSLRHQETHSASVALWMQRAQAFSLINPLCSPTGLLPIRLVQK